MWHEPRMIPAWAGLADTDEVSMCARRFCAFPPHLASSYLTREEAARLHQMGCEINAEQFTQLTGKHILLTVIVGNVKIQFQFFAFTFRYRSELLPESAVSPPVGALSKIPPCAMGHSAVHLQ